MEFIWNDGGRASSGFVGQSGDCVARSIAIATGSSYRDVYQDLGKASEKSPRDGVYTHISDQYLRQAGWKYHSRGEAPFQADSLPSGTVIVHLEKPDQRSCGHFCTVINHVVHDTWNPSDELDYQVTGFWISEKTDATPKPTAGSSPLQDAENSMTQKEFDRVLHRLRSLDNTASNHASTEGEKRNALRMMQNLMLRHNLSREDITEDDDVDHVRLTRIACPVNGRRACQWEKSLAYYMTNEIFPMVQSYTGTRGHRTLFWFYGPVDDVKNCITLFREMLLTIASAAQLQYRGHTRGSGASYAEGYVAGLPRYLTSEESQEEKVISETALIHARTLAVHNAARNWLKIECGVSLVSASRYGRSQHDPSAANRGSKHGAKHDVSSAAGRRRITNG